MLRRHSRFLFLLVLASFLFLLASGFSNCRWLVDRFVYFVDNQEQFSSSGPGPVGEMPAGTPLADESDSSDPPPVFVDDGDESDPVLQEIFDDAFGGQRGSSSIPGYGQPGTLIITGKTAPPELLELAEQLGGEAVTVGE